MVTFKCRDVGMTCDFEASAETKDELMKVIVRHGEDAHGIKTIPPDLMSNVQKAIKDAD